MHLLIDARALKNRIDGIGQYTLNILSVLPKIQGYRFSVILAANLEVPLPKEQEHIKYYKTYAKRYGLIEYFYLRKKISLLKPDAFFSTSPYLYPFLGCPSFFTLHDLFNVAFPSHFSDMPLIKAIVARIFFRLLTFVSVKSATSTFTVSNYSKAKIIDYYKLPPKNVCVVKQSINPLFFKEYTNDAISLFNIKNSMPKRFILHVGNLKPYKNIEGILHAFAKYLALTNDTTLKLIFTSKSGRGYKQAIATINKLSIQDRVEMREYFSAEDMPLLYRSSIGLFFPSLEEGFGLPVVEALHCGTPVVTSRGTSTEEVANGHAFLVNPIDIDDMVKGLYFLVEKEGLREQRIPVQDKREWVDIVGEMLSETIFIQ